MECPQEFQITLPLTPEVFGFELIGSFILQRRVKAFDIVGVLQKGPQPRLCLLESLLVMHAHLLAFDGLQETFHARVLGWMAQEGHADLDAHTAKSIDVGKTAILLSPVRMVDQPGAISSA